MRKRGVMTFTQKIDYRRRNHKNPRKLFFSLHLVPVLLLVLFVIFFIINKNNDYKNEDRLTGDIASNITIDGDKYNANQELSGTIKISFHPGEFFPEDVNGSLKIITQFPIYYYCADERDYLWYDMNGSDLETGYPWENCPELQAEYDCIELGKQCCSRGVIGKIYGNLFCSDASERFGFCGDNCSNLEIKKSLKEFIALSDESQNGNYTNFTYKYFNGTSLLNFPGNPSGAGIGFCFNTSGLIIPPKDPQNYEACTDSDGNNTFQVGECSDWLGNNKDDSCNGANAVEWYCPRPTSIKLEPCSAYCNSVICKSGPIQGWYSSCNDTEPPTETLIKAIDCSVLGEDKKPVCLYAETSNEGWYQAYVCSNYSSDCVDGCGSQTCNSGKSCSGWDNSYNLDIEKFNIESPSENAKYAFSLEFNWNNTLIESSYSNFLVEATHRECVNQTCMIVSGAGNDECSGNLECREACQPSWSCSGWGTCINGQQTQTCVDANNCRTSSGRPSLTQSCKTCDPVWNCVWQSCLNNFQTKVCSDTKSCDASNLSYVADSRTCCEESWKCGKWDSCKNGVQTRQCEEMNNCETEFGKPIVEQNCKKFVFPWLIAIIIFLSLVIIVFLLILFFNGSFRLHPHYGAYRTTGPTPASMPRDYNEEKDKEEFVENEEKTYEDAQINEQLRVEPIQETEENSKESKELSGEPYQEIIGKEDVEKEAIQEMDIQSAQQTAQKSHLPIQIAYPKRREVIIEEPGNEVKKGKPVKRAQKEKIVKKQTKSPIKKKILKESEKRSQIKNQKKISRASGKGRDMFKDISEIN